MRGGYHSRRQSIWSFCGLHHCNHNCKYCHAKYLFIFFIGGGGGGVTNHSGRLFAPQKLSLAGSNNYLFFPNRSLLLRVLISNQRGNRKHTKRQAASTAARPGIAKDARDVAVKPQNQKAKIQKSKKQSQKPKKFKASNFHAIFFVLHCHDVFDILGNGE